MRLSRSTRAKRCALAAVAAAAAPVALPAPKSGTVGARPDVGLVLPLSTSATESGDLVGAGGHSNPALSDPTAAKVLSRGDPLPAAAGRADDFSWPRPGAAASAAPDTAPQPASLTPPPKRSGDSQKPAADAGKDTKNKAANETTKPSRPAKSDLDGAPVPPAPVGSR